MFGIGGTELAIIALFAFLIFGPDKVPELARTLGKAMRTFKRAQEDMERVIRSEMYSSDSKPATPNPLLTPKDTEAVADEKSDAPSAAAQAIWAATDEDEEEEDEE